MKVEFWINENIVVLRALYNFMVARRIVRILDHTGLFDKNWYLEIAPDAQKSWFSSSYHYAIFSFPKGLAPNPLMDVGWYRSQYPDVECSGLNPVIHYALYGADELRDPGPNFSTGGYLASLGNSEAIFPNPLGDCVQKTAAEACRGTENDSYYYLQPKEFEQSGLFDQDWYLKKYSDVAMSALKPIVHFSCIGIWQGRAPNGVFDPDWYRQAHDELLSVKAHPLVHYIRAGLAENRRPGPKFDPEWYSRQYETDEVGENPVLHYLRQGKRLGCRTRNPHIGYGHRLVREQEELVFGRKSLIDHCNVMILKPQFLVFVEGENEELKKITVKSLGEQLYQNFRIVTKVVDPVGSLDFLVWIQAGDILHETALYEFASSINSDDTVDLIYSDEDILAEGRRQDPYFKPAWSPDTLESFNYIGTGACFRLRGDSIPWDECSGHYDFLLKFTEEFGNVVHISKVLVHKKTRITDLKSLEFIEAERNALSGRLSRTGREGKVWSPAPGVARYSIEIQPEARPLVSIIIPTAGKVVEVAGREIDFLMNLIGSIIEDSTLRHFEIIVVDNGDLDASRLNRLRDWGCKMTTYVEPVFNIARKLNQGAELAKGEYLLLMNDDIEPLKGDWIERLCDHLQKPHVGVVGGKLLFPDGTIQHAGVVSNIGYLDHVRKNYPGDEDGVFFSTVASRNYKAVTGACMLTRTNLFRQVGGYTEELPVSFNDADYCLKLGELGFYSVYAAEVELIHFESQSRIPKMNMDEFLYVQKRWGSSLSEDKFYNENVYEICPPTFELRWA